MSSSRKSPVVGCYTLLQTLGAGAMGKVKLAEHHVTHEQVAIKIIRKADLGDRPDIQEKVHQEIALMRLMDHPHILKVHEILESQKHIYLVLEYAKHGELFEYLVTRGTLPVPDAIRILRQIFYALDYLHSNSICHRDLKLENILLDEHDNVKIADFGFARWMRHNVARTSCGSPHYTSPEVISGKSYDGSRADVWSCGVILYTLLAGRLPFDEPSLRELASRIQSGQFRMPDFPDAVQDLIRRLLAVDPAQRIGMERIKRHPAFRLGLPKGYACPSPLPLPTVSQPIDPADLDAELKQIFFGVGYGSEAELLEDLRSPESTMAKAFCVLLSHRGSFEALPWPTEEEEGASPEDVPASTLLVSANGDLCFSARELPAKPDDQISEAFSSSSIYSLSETARWDPVAFRETYEAKNVSYVRDVSLPLEQVMAQVQASLNGAGFDWFYPNDFLIVARKQRQKVDVILNAEYQADASITITIHLIQGDPMEFSALACALAQAICELRQGT